MTGDMLEKLRQHVGKEVAILAGSPNFGLSVQGVVASDNGNIYIDKKLEGQTDRYRMDITDYVRKCDRLDVRPVDVL